MNTTKKEEEYLFEIEGIFYWGDWQIIPYNHWKNDCEWLVVIPDSETSAVFVTVTALNPKEACVLAMIQYKNVLEDIEDE